MKKFKFNLESVLKYRESIERNEKSALSVLNGSMIHLLNQLEALKKEYEKAIHDFEQTSRNGIQAQLIMAKQIIIKNIEAAIDCKLEEIKGHQKKIDKQTTIVVKARQDAKAVDKLKEKGLKQYNKDLAKDEENFIEEFVSNRTARALLYK